MAFNRRDILIIVLGCYIVFFMFIDLDLCVL